MPRINDDEKAINQLISQIKEVEDSFNTLIFHISKMHFSWGYLEGQMQAIIENLTTVDDQASSHYEKYNISQIKGVIGNIQHQISAMRFSFCEEEPTEEMATQKLSTETKSKSLKDAAKEFLDALNQSLEEGNHESSLKDNLNDIFELLEATVEHL